MIGSNELQNLPDLHECVNECIIELGKIAFLINGEGDMTKTEHISDVHKLFLLLLPEDGTYHLMEIAEKILPKPGSLNAHLPAAVISTDDAMQSLMRRRLHGEPTVPISQGGGAAHEAFVVAEGRYSILVEHNASHSHATHHKEHNNGGDEECEGSTATHHPYDIPLEKQLELHADETEMLKTNAKLVYIVDVPSPVSNLCVEMNICQQGELLLKVKSETASLRAQQHQKLMHQIQTSTIKNEETVNVSEPSSTYQNKMEIHDDNKSNIKNGITINVNSCDEATPASAKPPPLSLRSNSLDLDIENEDEELNKHHHENKDHPASDCSTASICGSPPPEFPSSAAPPLTASGPPPSHYFSRTSNNSKYGSEMSSSANKQEDVTAVNDRMEGVDDGGIADEMSKSADHLGPSANNVTTHTDGDGCIECDCSCDECEGIEACTSPACPLNKVKTYRPPDASITNPATAASQTYAGQLPMHPPLLPFKSSPMFMSSSATSPPVQQFSFNPNYSNNTLPSSDNILPGNNYLPATVSAGVNPQIFKGMYGGASSINTIESIRMAQSALAQSILNQQQQLQQLQNQLSNGANVFTAGDNVTVVPTLAQQLLHQEQLANNVAAFQRQRLLNQMLLAAYQQQHMLLSQRMNAQQPNAFPKSLEGSNFVSSSTAPHAKSKSSSVTSSPPLNPASSPPTSSRSTSVLSDIVKHQSGPLGSLTRGITLRQKKILLQAATLANHQQRDDEIEEEDVVNNDAESCALVGNDLSSRGLETEDLTDKNVIVDTLSHPYSKRTASSASAASTSAGSMAERRKKMMRVPV